MLDDKPGGAPGGGGGFHPGGGGGGIEAIVAVRVLVSKPERFCCGYGALPALRARVGANAVIRHGRLAIRYCYSHCAPTLRGVKVARVAR